MGLVRFDFVEAQQQRGGPRQATTIKIAALCNGALKGKRDHGHGNMQYGGGGDSMAARSDERWSRLQGGLDGLCIRLGSIVSWQQLVAAQLSQSSKALEQVLCGHQVMAKKLEKMDQVVAQQKFGGLKVKTTPIGDQGLELMSGGVLHSSPAVSSAPQVFVEMPDQCNMSQMFKGMPTSQPEQETFGASVVAEGASVSVLDETPFEKVVWDEELFSDPSLHDGLLMQIAQGGKFMGGRENMMESSVPPSFSSDLIPGDDSLTLLSKGTSMSSVHKVLDERLNLNVVWDNIISQDCRLHHGLLVEKEHMSDEKKSNTETGFIPILGRLPRRSDSGELFVRLARR